MLQQTLVNMTHFEKGNNLKRSQQSRRLLTRSTRAQSRGAKKAVLASEC
jgi:hypothetical protein